MTAIKSRRGQQARVNARMAFPGHRIGARVLALAALAMFALAPLAHGIVHGEHLIEAALDQTHAPHDTARADGAPGSHEHGACALYQLCLAAGGPAPVALEAVPVRIAHTLDIPYLATLLPDPSTRDRPRERGPPLA